MDASVSHHPDSSTLLDSDIMTICLSKLANLGIPALGMHDSVRVAASHIETLRKIMTEACFEVAGIYIPIK
jgi:hypothetical protein